MKQILSPRLEFAQSQKPSKSQKRKQAKKLQDAEREARIASEKEQLGPTDRSLEEAALHELLRPQSLHIKEIPADGNCLYRALEDQLKLTSSCTPAAASHGHQASADECTASQCLAWVTWHLTVLFARICVKWRPATCEPIQMTICRLLSRIAMIHPQSLRNIAQMLKTLRPGAGRYRFSRHVASWLYACGCMGDL